MSVVMMPTTFKSQRVSRRPSAAVAEKSAISLSMT